VEHRNKPVYYDSSDVSRHAAVTSFTMSDFRTAPSSGRLPTACRVYIRNQELQDRQMNQFALIP
jgi:hypothetical protein